MRHFEWFSNNVQGKYVIVFEAFEESDGFYYERHEEGNSKQNYDFDETYGFEFSMLTNHKGSLEAIAAEIVTISLKKFNYDCNEDNSMKMTDCINDFYAENLGCQLPWTTSAHCSKSSFFVQKFYFDFPRKNVGWKLVKMLGFWTF